MLSKKWEGIYTIKQGKVGPSHNNQCAAQPSHHTACCSPDRLPVCVYLILQYPPWVQFPWKAGGEPDVVLGNSQAENQDEMLSQDLEADSIGQMILLFCRRQTMQESYFYEPPLDNCSILYNPASNKTTVLPMHFHSFHSPLLLFTKTSSQLQPPLNNSGPFPSIQSQLPLTSKGNFILAVRENQHFLFTRFLQCPQLSEQGEVLIRSYDKPFRRKIIICHLG